jgi:hypothetical protein
VIVNALVTRLMLAGVPLAGAVARRSLRARIRSFAKDQEELRRAYGVGPDTPIRGYDDDTRARVRAFARDNPGTRLATTSASTARPKEIAYTRERLALYQRDSQAFGAMAYARHRVRRIGLFILASLKSDDSFASLVLHNRGTMPPYVAGLVEPSRYLATERMNALVNEHGATAARVFLLALADPGVLYATNPSTVAAFFTEDGPLRHARARARHAHHLRRRRAPPRVGVAVQAQPAREAPLGGAAPRWMGGVSGRKAPFAAVGADALRSRHEADARPRRRGHVLRVSAPGL